MTIPMCPGCRALLGPGDSKCPYCDWDLRITEIRRSGGPVERLLRPMGGLVPTLVGANVAFYVLTAMVHGRLLMGVTGDEQSPLSLLVGGLLSPSGIALYFAGGLVPDRILEGEAWRLLCPLFLHGGILHILMNMSALLDVGRIVEAGYGSGKALAIYLLAGLAGSVASLAWHLHTGAPMIGIGASGAIIGLWGVLAAWGFRIGGEPGKRLWKPVLKSVGIIFVLGLVLSFSGSVVQLDNSAHAGGFLFGLGAGFLCTLGARARGDPAAVKSWDALALVLAAVALLAFVPPAIAIARGVE